MKKTRDLGREAPLYQWFHRNTKMTVASRYARVRPYSTHPEPKEYQCCAKRVNIAVTEAPPPMSLTDALVTRKSTRDFDPVTPMNLAELSSVLYFSYGVTHRIGDFDFRAAPSAGGRYPVEVYVVANTVQGLEPGLYHYDVTGMALEQLAPGQQNVASWSLDGNVLNTAHAVVLLTAVFSRTISKYGNRGYRYALLDAGHLGQNLYLTATACGLGCSAIGGFFEDKIEATLQLDGVTESAILLLVIGRPNWLA